MLSSKSSSNRKDNDNPLFKGKDYLIIRRALDQLPLDQKIAIELRFFYNFSIQEIANSFRMTWDQANAFLESILPKLKTLCLSEDQFSRSVPLARAA